MKHTLAPLIGDSTKQVKKPFFSLFSSQKGLWKRDFSFKKPLNNDKMSIKQKLSSITAGLTRIGNRLIWPLQGYWPTLDEIKNSEIKSLASRLKGESYEETLTNIVEWQDRNMEFWAERHPISTLLMYVYFRIFAAFLIFTFGVLPIVILVLLILGINTVLVILLTQIVVWLFLNPWSYIAILTVITTTILATIILILHSNRKIPWKEVPRALKNILWPSISIQFLLKNNLGICRDYAKLTVCLLSNIYPDEQIYFATAPSHVATGIMIKGNLYMLDQRLPILTMDKWRNYRKARLKDEVEKFTKESLKKHECKKVDIICLPSTTRTASLDTKELAMAMEKLLNIKERIGGKAISSFEISWTWKKGAILYEDNEMVNYSLARRLKMEVSNELIRMNQIASIQIRRYKDDLIFGFTSDKA